MEQDEAEYYAMTDNHSMKEQDGPEFEGVPDPLVIHKRGKPFEYLKTVSIDIENPALVVGWFEDRVLRVVAFINDMRGVLPEPPEFLNLDQQLTPFTFKDSIHMQLSSLAGGSCSNIIAPCSLDQVPNIARRLSEIQRHPFMQEVMLRIGRPGPLAMLG
eukprot:CAMPEP_0170437480 /NCGR_PEP_ID=MMETSP0117_2-20130122/44707_1 /TAXON_ID=400756 /ORGANISM="Durinskia baltica, Strain CSIRO CS-38" /LENGTH=158 /DNA_ID=CAMNT_0010697605 /DNA_START=50 /DNA_END=522 /DNA_ORIENTATION=+